MTDAFAALSGRLQEALRTGLPGPEAQARMSPRPRAGWRPGVLPRDCRSAAGLLLVYPHRDSTHLLLTLRRSDLPDHGGQVSLPGGEVEPGESLPEAALREAREEVGLDPADVTLSGALTPLHIPVSRFVLHPFVAVASRRPALAPSDDEVERLVEVRLALLADPAALRVTTAGSAASGPRTIPYFAVDGVRVWGATAMVLAEFLALLGHRLRPPV